MYKLQNNERKKKYNLKTQIFNLLQFIAHLVLCMGVFVLFIVFCISAYANVYFQTTIITPQTINK